MRSTLIVGALAFAASSVHARALPGFTLSPRHAFGTTGQCAVQPLGSGPVTNNPDTAAAFQSNPVYAAAALSAPTPNGYTVAYQNLTAASSTGGYLGYEDLTSYNTSYCAAQCCSFWPGCTSFNIYYERDPTLDPGVNCTNPPSTTNIKCAYFNATLSTADATNVGQYCQDFHVVVAGSDAYNVIPGSCPASSSSTTTTTTTTTTTLSTTTTTTTTTTTSKAAPTTTTTTTTTTPAATQKPWQPVTPTPSPITKCPTPETTYTATDGSTWAICKGTDYQGTTTQNVNWITSDNACAAACDTTAGCTKAIFYAQNSVCYIKGSPLQWVTNPIYDSIRQLTPPTPKATTTSASSWNSWSQPQQTCFLWICW